MSRPSRRRRPQARPRRVGVQIKTFCKAFPAVGAHRLYHTRQPSPKNANLSHQITPIYLHHLVDFSPKCKLFIKKCCFLTFPMQNSPVFAVLVGDVFLSPPENAPLPRPVDFSAKNQLILPQQSAKIISIFFGGPPPQRSEYDEQYPGALRQPGL